VVVCFGEVFILQGLRGADGVSVVDAGFTETILEEVGVFGKIGIDSIGFADVDVTDPRSVDSKAVLAYMGVWWNDNLGTPRTPGVS
jgi:hypothetical protein